MSKIKVWTSDGEWSKEVEGLDKMHLMKKTICFGSRNFRNYPLEGFEIDAIALCDDLSIYFDENNLKEYIKEVNSSISGGYFFAKFSKANLKEAKTFKLPLPALRSVEKEDPLCTPLYDELITAAKIPATASKDYCLLFKFEEE